MRSGIVCNISSNGLLQIKGSNQDRAISLALAGLMFSACGGFDFITMRLERGEQRALSYSTRLEVVFKRFTADRACDFALCFSTRKKHYIAVKIIFLAFLGKLESVMFCHAQHFQNCQHRRKLNVLVSAFQSRNRRRTHIGDSRQPLLSKP